jgi:HAMP domain
MESVAGRQLQLGWRLRGAFACSEAEGGESCSPRESIQPVAANDRPAHVTMRLSSYAVWLARSTTKLVEELTKAAERRHSDDCDYDVGVPLASTIELKELASALNAMRTAVADRESTVQRQANHDALTGLPARQESGGLSMRC